MDRARAGQGALAAAGAAASLPSLFDAHDHTRLWLQSKLSGEWSAQAGAGGLTDERLAALSRSFGSLDSMVKVRLLLAGLFLPRVERSRLQPLLAELAGQAASSQDEWVRATAAVCGDYSGPMDMRVLMAQFPLVRDTVTSLASQLAGLETPFYLLPHTEQYMHANISRLPSAAQAVATTAAAAAAAAAGGAPKPGMAAGGGAGVVPVQHFRLRESPAATLAELGLAAPGAASASVGGAGGGSAGGALSLALHGFGAGLAAAAGLGGAGGEAKGALSLGRGAPGGAGEVSSLYLRSRADVSHSSAKESKQGPPTPSGKGAAGIAVPPLRMNRARSLVVPGEGPGQGQGQALESPQGGPASAAHTPAGGLQLLPLPLGRRDSGHITPRHGGWPSSTSGTPHAPPPGSAPNSATAAAALAAAASGGAFGDEPGLTLASPAGLPHVPLHQAPPGGTYDEGRTYDQGAGNVDRAGGGSGGGGVDRAGSGNCHPAHGDAMELRETEGGWQEGHRGFSAGPHVYPEDGGTEAGPGRAYRRDVSTGGTGFGEAGRQHFAAEEVPEGQVGGGSVEAGMRPEARQGRPGLVGQDAAYGGQDEEQDDEEWEEDENEEGEEEEEEVDEEADGGARLAKRSRLEG